MTSRPWGKGVSRSCDDNNKTLVVKSVNIGGGGVQNYQKLRDVIYGWPQSGTTPLIIGGFMKLGQSGIVKTATETVFIE